MAASRAHTAALLTGVAAISLAAPLFRLASPTPPLVAAGIRLTIASVLLAPLVWRGMRSGALPRGHVGAAALGGVAYAVHFGTWVASLELTSVAASVSLVTATPLMLALVSLVTGRDRPSPRLWGALALAAGGVGLIGHDAPGQGALLGDGLALLGALAMATYLLLSRAQGPQLAVLPFMGVSVAVGAVLLLSVALLAGDPLLPASRQAWLALAGAALLPQLVGHGLLTWSLRRATPTEVGLATVGEPVGAALLAWALFAEVPGVLTLAGCVCTATGVLIASTGRRS